jgi:predicted extracellular nuclease
VRSASPLINKNIFAKGVVTATRFGSNTRNGFYMSDATPDNNPLTSDSIFVYVGSSFSLPFNVQEGDEVLVSGKVSENGGNTNIAISAITRVRDVRLPVCIYYDHHSIWHILKLLVVVDIAAVCNNLSQC